jgi:hypothetical protein
VWCVFLACLGGVQVLLTTDYRDAFKYDHRWVGSTATPQPGWSRAFLRNGSVPVDPARGGDSLSCCVVVQHLSGGAAAAGGGNQGSRAAAHPGKSVHITSPRYAHSTGYNGGGLRTDRGGACCVLEKGAASRGGARLVFGSRRC